MEHRAIEPERPATPKPSDPTGVGHQESLELADIHASDAAMGEGFSECYAWYLKEGIESAGESPDSDAMHETAKSAAETGTRQMQLF